MISSSSRKGFISVLLTLLIGCSAEGPGSPSDATTTGGSRGDDSSTGGPGETGGAGTGGPGGAGSAGTRDQGGTGGNGTGAMGSVNNDEPIAQLSDQALAITTGVDFRLEAGNFSLLGDVAYSLMAAPVGMTIQVRTGVVTWHPTADQTGDFTVTVTAAVDSRGTYTDELRLSVTAGPADPVGLYVAPNGSDSTGDGSPSNPYLTISEAADQTAPGDTVYVRGGIYRNAGYLDGDNHKWDKVAVVKNNGTSGAWITYRPLGGEHAKLEYDGADGFKVIANYIIVDGFEVQGPAWNISYDEAISHWWDEPMPYYYSSGAITTNREHIVVRNCVIHHATHKGLGGFATDHLTYENNIVYDNSWWTFQGGHGVSVPAMTSTDGNAAATKIIYRGNIAFANEQRIMSRVWSKGKAILQIDEGYGFHMQDTENNHVGQVLIESNLSVFNGKAGIGVYGVESATIRNNSTYYNARTTGPGNGDGLILQSLSGATVQNNLFHPEPDRRAFHNLGSTATFSGNYATAGSDTSLPSGITQLGEIFLSPQALDFTPAAALPAGTGAPPLKALWDKIQDYGIEVKPTEYVVDYSQQTQDIIDAVPSGSVVNKADWPNSVTVDLPNGHPGGSNFLLDVRHP